MHNPIERKTGRRALRRRSKEGPISGRTRKSSGLGLQVKKALLTRPKDRHALSLSVVHDAHEVTEHGGRHRSGRGRKELRRGRGRHHELAPPFVSSHHRGLHLLHFEAGHFATASYLLTCAGVATVLEGGRAYNSTPHVRNSSENAAERARAVASAVLSSCICNEARYYIRASCHGHCESEHQCYTTYVVSAFSLWPFLFAAFVAYARFIFAICTLTLGVHFPRKKHKEHDTRLFRHTAYLIARDSQKVLLKISIFYILLWANVLFLQEL